MYMHMETYMCIDIYRDSVLCAIYVYSYSPRHCSVCCKRRIKAASNLLNNFLQINGKAGISTTWTQETNSHSLHEPL